MKILSINLWFEKYGHKTLAQLNAFRQLKYDTYAATVINNGKSLKAIIYFVDGHKLDVIATESFDKELFGAAYFAAFRYLFDYAINNDFDIIYMRRLMSKLVYAAPHFKHVSRSVSLVYEIPTYPFDVPANKLYALRDKLETFAYNSTKRHIAVTSACLYQNAKVPKNWLIFENGIDISNYSIHDVAPLKDGGTVNMLMIANMQPWHRSERILHAIKNYSGEYKLHLIVASPDSKEYSEMKALAKELKIDSMVEFNDFLPIGTINEIAADCHIAVGQLSGSEYGVMNTHAIKHKDYGALSLPFFSTCTDNSFPESFPYYYFIKDTDADIDLDAIIKWYLDIRKDPDYRIKMYEYAKEKLQYTDYAKEIIERVNKWSKDKKKKKDNKES